MNLAQGTAIDCYLASWPSGWLLQQTKRNETERKHPTTLGPQSHFLQCTIACQEAAVAAAALVIHSQLICKNTIPAFLVQSPHIQSRTNALVVRRTGVQSIEA